MAQQRHIESGIARRIGFQRARRQRRDLPAGAGGARGRARHRAQQHDRDARAFGRERKAPARGQIEQTRLAPGFDQHGAQRRAACRPGGVHACQRTQNWTLTKPSTAKGGHGIVVSQNREAAEAGVAILEAGGNAADAAVAACFALAAVEPWNSGLGGIGFALVLKANETRAQVVDFGPVAPRRADPADYPLTGAMKKDLFTWPEVVGDVNIHGRSPSASPPRSRAMPS
jgi:hypothetical protein